MFKLKYISLLSISVFILYFISNNNSKKITLPENATILAFGDSLTYGTGSEEGYSYPDFLALRTGHHVIKDAIPGQTAIDALPRFIESVNVHKPDLVILLIGGNDILRQLNLSQTELAIESMIVHALNNNINIILLGVPTGILNHRHAMYDRIANKYNINTDKNIIHSILLNNNLKSDPVHFNKHGYKILSDKIIDTFL